MALSIDGDHVLAGQRRVALREFPRHVEWCHLQNVPRTHELEAAGAELRRSAFPDEQLSQFIRDVCQWGGYAGVRGRILKNNSIEVIRQRFGQALAALDVDPVTADSIRPALTSALCAVNQLRDLGRPSFASKHLRFLCPVLSPVLDSIIADEYGYPLSPEGYGDYAADCLRVASRLRLERVENPMSRVENAWFAGDVDMAVFALVALWSR
ncbi:hypothetical protein [Frigoriglobus tundricola]|uniref:Uncharacterized protein n=1 Tax=Frigoriglobus tundricola TaxID=2774151 RepID=A0A6M5YUL8_9BACT|nr:hypothetical protein [Frigoriglobus tundricola]QJW97758.1 hypothetical protein FTUN_5336 [Frigoriglobus tundricola]